VIVSAYEENALACWAAASSDVLRMSWANLFLRNIIIQSLTPYLNYLALGYTPSSFLR
jgi:hypothetical protein